MTSVQKPFSEVNLSEQSGDIRNSAGTIMASVGPFAFSYSHGTQEFYIPLPHKADYANGTYTGELLVENQVVATTVTVGG